MSAKSISLKSPITIVVVVFLLGAVTVLNVRTFGPLLGRNETSAGYRAQAHPPVPSDMRQLAAHETELVRSRPLRDPALMVASLDRDPFFPRQKQPRPVVTPTGGGASGRKASAPAPKPLVCSAIMLGGRRPMAIINGEGRHPGDDIRGMILTGIDADKKELLVIRCSLVDSIF